MPDKNYVAYYRVSTQSQGNSGLGLEAQRKTVVDMVGRAAIEKEFIEVESGRSRKRAQLNAAISYCKLTGCVLIVAKLDRLGRMARHLWEIKENLELKACDVPYMDTMSFGIYATVAQSEAERIRERTKAALAAKKAQGIKLGSPQNLTDKARENSCKSRRLAAQENPLNKKAYAKAKDLRAMGFGLQRIANKLNQWGERGVKGGKFYACTVKKLFALYERQR